MTLSDLGLPSSLKGEIFGIVTEVWHFDLGVFLDGNSLRWKILVQALKMKEKEIYTGSS